jgi:lipopolysaccharide biosynthesis regulator YciM
VNEDLLKNLTKKLRQASADGSVPPGREAYLSGLDLLRNGEVARASEAFGRGARRADPPFDALSTVARGECERVRGRHGAALRHWRGVANRDSAPAAARYMAWLSIAALAADRDDPTLLTRAEDALERLQESGEI